MRTASISRTRLSAAATVAVLVAALCSAVFFAPVAARAATTGSITLAVSSARTVNKDGVSPAGFIQKGDPVTAYKWMINVDDTGNPGTSADPGFGLCLPLDPSGRTTNPNPTYDPAKCPWPSTRPTSGIAPIVAQGDETDLGRTKALDNLPVGKYLISVTADHYKIDGAHFTVTGGTQQVNVQMQPLPLPLSTLRLQVFNDNLPVDATWEMDAERGLAGFTARLTDVLGLVSTDYYGNALCTRYLRVGNNGNVSTAVDSQLPIAFDANNRPIIDPKSTGQCVSDSTGQIVIPNLGPDRYAATVTPPKTTGFQWVQTTTLEGGHDHDIWPQEGDTGYDTEQLKGAENVPPVQFGFVRTQSLPTRPNTGTVKGNVLAGLPYIGGQNGQVVDGVAGAKEGGPIVKPWLALSNLDNNDQQVYVGRGNADGSFSIANVPAGTYQLSMWDDDQDYILYSTNVTVTAGQTTDAGNQLIVGWFTHVYGHVFIDSNGNGKRDPGETGVPQFGLTVRERDNSLMDQASNTATTDDSGFYDIRETYPLGKFLILEGFNTRYRTTGITYQGENEPDPTTQLGSLVDINFLAIIGLGGQIDWGVEPYTGTDNGGIVGTVTYDTTRNELDPRYAVTESYQPGIPGVPVNLYATVPCGTNQSTHCANGHELDDNGAYTKGPQLQDTYTSEEWAPPSGCTARQYDGTPLTLGVYQDALPPLGDPKYPCVEAPMQGIAVGASDSEGGSQTVNGNYGFATSKLNLYAPGDPKNPAPNRDLPLYADLAAAGYEEQPLPALDYIVSVDIPNDPVDGKPMYKVTSEEDVNIFRGDTYLPQQNWPPTSLAQANDTPAGDQPTPAQPPSQQAGIVSPCAGELHTVHVTDQTFLNGGGSPFEGQDRPSCQAKLVSVRAGQATAPNFNLFTEVPVPTHFWGLTLNDLGLTLDQRSVNYGEAQGIPNVPVGLYDFSGRLVDTTHTDFNGLYEALEPSTDTYNCPVPAGPCPNMYRFVGNDPGGAGSPNSDYNPRYRTIATNFQGWPGLYTVTDEAPTQVASTILTPGGTPANATMCDLGPKYPQLFATDHPYVTRGSSVTVTLTGTGFGTTRGKLTVGSTSITPPIWNDSKIVFNSSTVPAGSQQITITRSDGQTQVNGLTLQVLSNVGATGSSPTNPRLFEVGPTKAYKTVQAALEAARPTSTNPYDLVVVWPNTPTKDNPRGEYTENVVVHHTTKIQGVGPGGFLPNGTWVPGSILDGAGFNPDTTAGTNWVNLVGGLTHSGSPVVPDAAVITVLDDPTAPLAVRTGSTAWSTSIDGLQITGGAQSDFAGNVNDLTGVVRSPAGPGGALVTQGGGVYAHNNVRNLRITNDVLTGNSGSYGGAVRLGTPYVGDNHNYGLVLANNQIRSNGGTNLAGGVGLFTGSDDYTVRGNAFCDNFSAEYGGAITAFGYNTHTAVTNTIDHNRLWFNSSYDEGGAIMIAGELPSDPNGLSEGTGSVTIDANIVSANLADDDGGAIRLLQVSGSHISRAAPGTITISNNTIANNVSAHEGGGLAFDDAAFVNVVNNTVVKNITTATAITSDGLPAPAGLSTAANSVQLQARLCNTTLFSGSGTLCATTFSKPTILNDVFWDNRAGTFLDGSIRGIGGKLLDGTADPGAINNWDAGVADLPNPLHVEHTLLQDPQGTDGAAGSDPRFVDPFDVTVNILSLRTYPGFIQAAIVTEILPPTLLGDWHLKTGTPPSPARGLGVASTTAVWGPGTSGFRYTVNAPNRDIDTNPRPTGTRWDAGSDQMSS